MNNVLFSTETQEELDILELSEIEELRDLILYNDDVNTFDFVIDALVQVCKHDLVQAEQCTYLVHYAGKCAVKRGEFTKLEPLCSALLDRGLSAEIE
jgi:ATP-dependent Clp protease adaptor protein ClpS